MSWKQLELKIPPLLLLVIFVLVLGLIALWLPGLTLVLSGAFELAIFFALWGLLMPLLGVLAFRRANTTVDPRVPEKSAQLVTSGIYRLSRNPMYLGFLLLLISWAVYLSNMASVASVPLFALYLSRFQIRPEERFMRAKFGQAYVQYQRAVRRWI